ncbi:hypothetical protein ACFYXV_20530 [Streptomyces sp. NPDC002181]
MSTPGGGAGGSGSATHLPAGRIAAGTRGRRVLPMGRPLAPEEHPET